MSIENGIDEVSRVFEIPDGRGGTVRSYRIFEVAEFPEAVTEFPCALSFPTGVTPYVGDGASISYELWTGITEFHLWGDISRAHYPELMLYFARIRNAVAANIKLSGKVSYFQFRDESPSMQGPVILRYGEEAEHLGIVAHWMVKENLTVPLT